MQVDRSEGHSFVAAALGPDSVVVDLGLNRGSFGSAIARRFGCRVIGVEPDETVFARARPIPGLTIERAAIGGRDGATTLFLQNGRDATVDERLVRGDAECAEVPVMTLSTLFERHGLGRVDLMKVDIEGAEIETLLAAPDALLSRVAQLSVEYHDWLDPSLAEDTRTVDARLRGLGFQRLAFSRDTSDVLYLGPGLALTPGRRLAVLLRYRYARGVWRRLRHLLR